MHFAIPNTQKLSTNFSSNSFDTKEKTLVIFEVKFIAASITYLSNNKAHFDSTKTNFINVTLYISSI